METYRFEHAAMATEFVLTIKNEEAEYANSVCQQVFDLIDTLETKLSRFVPDSDISRINRMKKAGEQLPVDFETWEVVKKAIYITALSYGAFDIGVAKHMDVFRATKERILTEFEMNKALQKVQQDKQNARLFVDPDKPMVYCVEPGMYFDLGGIGKGYALDQVEKLMHELEVSTYSLSAGESTILFKNDTSVLPYWSYAISTKTEQKTLQLSNVTVSASGTYFQGNHIFDPRTGDNDFVPDSDRVWVAAKDSAYSDAFSTAFFLLSAEEIEEIVAENEKILWMAYSKEGTMNFVPENDIY